MDVEVCVEIVGESEKAFRISDGYTTEWIPKSQIRNLDIHNIPEEGDHVIFEIPEWLAEKKGLI